MGHLPIVSRSTVGDITSFGAVRISASICKDVAKAGHIVGQVADLFADALAVREGDLLFPWTTGGGAVFDRSFVAAERARFRVGAPAPIEVPVKREFIEYNPPLDESKALDLWRPRLLWNAIGKKSLGRGRGLTHQTEAEDEELVCRLAESSTPTPRLVTATSDPVGASFIRIDTTRVDIDAEHEANLVAALPARRLSQLDPTRICWRSGRQFRIEKALEAWICENVDADGGASLRRVLEIPEARNVRAFNYLPYGVAGANIDIILWSAGANETAQCVIELKRGRLNRGECQEAAVQLLRYRDFLSDASRAYARDIEWQPVIISAKPARHFDVDSVAGVRHLVYDIDNEGNVAFDDR